MKTNGVPTCYFPTTAVFIDDSSDFLMNFSLQFDPKLSYRLYDSPQEAVQYLSQQDEENQFIKRCFSEYADGTRCPITNHTINLDLAAIHRELYNPSRFSMTSVIVVDYAMPGLNGLELCEQLKDHPAKKILLTGQTGEKTAVTAFNSGIIDRFILKSDPKVIDTINHTIADLQRQFFHSMSTMVIKALAVDSPNMLDDKVFFEFFNKICQEYEIVEYYLVETTGSFLMLTAEAKPIWLIVKREQDMQMYREFVVDNGAPKEIVDALDSGKQIPYFWRPNDYFQDDWAKWETSLYPAESLQGEEAYLYGLITETKDTDTDIDHAQIISYDDYLEKQDVIV